MARNLFKLVGEISVNGIKELNKGLTEIDKKAIRLGRQIDRTGKKITRMGATLTKNLTLPIVAAGFAINKTIDAASDLGETAAKVGELFGESAKDIEAWSKTTAETMGQSQQQAQDAAATFAIFAKSAGIGGKELVDFTTDFTALASDMASFFNTKPEEAITAIGAAFRGESEPIRRYGVLLDAATLKSKALEMGIISATTKALTPQQRVLAAGAVIMDQTTAAQGDFARTSDQLANKTRILEARMKNLSVEFGKVFLPIKLKLTDLIINKFLPAISKVVDWFSKLSPEVIETSVAIAAVVATAGPFLLILGQLVSAFKLLAPAIVTVNTLLMANPWVAAALAVGALTFAIIKLDKKAKAAEASNKRAIAIIDETRALRELRQEYESTRARLQHLKDTGKWYDPDELQQAINNIATINEQLKQGKKTIEDTPVPGGGGSTTKGGGGKKGADDGGAKAKIEWSKKLIQQRIDQTNNLKIQLDNQLALIKMEEAEEIANAEKTGAVIADIEKFYRNERTQAQEEYYTKLKELDDKNIENKKTAAEEEKRIAEELSDFKQSERDKVKDLQQQWIDEQVEAFAIVSDAIISFSNSMSQIIDNLYQKQFNLIDRKKAAEITAVTNSVMTEKQKQTKIAAIEEKFAKEASRLRKEQAKKDKAFAIFQAIINSAVGISKALAMGPPIGIVMAVLMGILGAVQIAAIASEPEPLAKGGMIKAGRGGIEAQIGEGREDELVLPMKTGVQALADALVDKFSAIEVPRPAIQSVAFAGAGGGAGSVGGRGNDVHLHIGTLIADDSGLKELEQTLLQFRVSNDQRKGRV